MHGGLKLEGHNLKLGAGGIREIEFFAQTRQLVAGGRDPSLRPRGTVDALAALAEAGWMEREVAQDLSALYAHHREIEHRVQMIDDAQTHALPKSDEGFDRLARLCGEGDTRAFRARLAEKLRRVEQLTGDFFQPVRGEVARAPDIPPAQAEIVARWPGYPALRSVRGQEIFERLKPDLLRRFQSAAKPEEALSNFDGFLKGLPAGVQLFSLFEANPPLVDLIVDICATAPGLSRYLSRHSGVLDAVLDGRFFADWPEAEGLTQELSGMLSGRDYEQQLDLARRWQKDWHFPHRRSPAARPDRHGRRAGANIPTSPMGVIGRALARRLRRDRPPPRATAGPRRHGGGDGQPRVGADERGLGPRPHRDLRPRDAEMKRGGAARSIRAAGMPRPPRR